MASNPAQRNIATQIRPASTETPVFDIAALASQIAAVRRTQETILRVQNDQDTRLEELSLSVSSSTARTPNYPTNLIYLAPTITLGNTMGTHLRWMDTSQLTQTVLLDNYYPEIRKATDEKTTPQATDGVPIEKLLKRGGSLMFFLSLASTVVWLTGDIALIHPAASVIGLLVSPCLYLMGWAARKQIAS